MMTSAIPARNMSLTPERVDDWLERFARQRILVVGDLMLDQYVAGRVERISPEAPVPVVRVTDERQVPGGASNVAANIRALRGGAAVCGVVGRDPAGAALRRLLRKQRVDLIGGPRLAGARTTVKTRILAERQQVVRVDRERPLPWTPAAVSAFAETAARAVARSTGVILEDYGKGVLQPRIVDAVLQAARRAGVPVGLDPKDEHALRGKGLTFATPNRKEAFQAAGLRDPGAARHPLEDAALLRAGERLMEKWTPRYLAITLGPHGMLLLRRGGPPAHLPTRAREVFDVSGAGDTVIAVCTLALAAGADWVEAAELANHAAGVVVGKMGTATCTPAELRAHVRGAIG